MKDEIVRAWADAQDLWRIFRRKFDALKPEATATSETRNFFVVPLLGLLGYQIELAGRGEVVNEKNYPISHRIPTRDGFPKDILEPFQPSRAHTLISQFKWAGLATTNYDRLIEKAYESNGSALQVPKAFIENGDRVEEHLRDPKGVMLLKLHGCVTRLANPACPLILTTDQYVTHRKGRSRIFDHLTNWAYETPIVFVGSSLQDADIR